MNTFSRRTWLAGTGALLLLGCKSDAPATLRVGRTGKGNYDMIIRAAKLEPKDLKVQYSDFQSGHLQVEALNGGSRDFGGMSEIPPVFAAASSIQSFKQIATVNADVNNQVVLVPKGSAIQTLADLKGKRVGYVRATTSQYFLIRMLQSAGLGWADIEPVSLNVSDGAAAFSAGSLDAWAIYGFPIQRALALDGARVLKTALGILSGNYIVSAHVDALAKPELRKAIGEYLGVYKRAFAWQQQHWDDYASLLAKEIDVPLQYAKDAVANRSGPTTLLPVSETSIKSQQEVADVFFDAGLIPKRVDVRPLWDDSFSAVIESRA
ncbi:MAG TPA: aliphatic sulfonate ABC transporter substrate-binding protein [Polyangiales bacterium]|nr:aliphatic sulfonate ABC transporter substrate-binding protein [Polyangiales bacterium]